MDASAEQLSFLGEFHRCLREWIFAGRISAFFLVGGLER